MLFERKGELRAIRETQRQSAREKGIRINCDCAFLIIIAANVASEAPNVASEALNL